MLTKNADFIVGSNVYIKYGFQYTFIPKMNMFEWDYKKIKFRIKNPNVFLYGILNIILHIYLHIIGSVCVTSPFIRRSVEEYIQDFEDARYATSVHNPKMDETFYAVEGCGKQARAHLHELSVRVKVANEEMM
ncbi:hypothetical protein ACJX0J_009357, partial [Zea mays]